jgi:ABC-type glycerol-3-phosphate transport system permease component
MPILLEVGKRSRGQRAVRIGIYGLLTLGAIGIIYPVLIVVGQTLSNDYDLLDNAIVPLYLRSRNDLLMKRVYSYAKKINLLASRHNRNAWSSHIGMRADTGYYRKLPELFEKQGLNVEAHEPVVADLLAFKKTLDPDRLVAIDFRIEDTFRPFLKEKYGTKADAFRERIEQGAELPGWFRMMFPSRKEQKKILKHRTALGIAIMNHELQSDYLNYYGLEPMRPGNFVVPFWRPGDSPKERLWSEFKASLPPTQLLIISSDAYWHTFLQLHYHKIDDLNKSWGTNHDGFYELTVPLTPPEDPTVRRDWDLFVVQRWPRSMLRIPATYAPQFRAYVRKQLISKAGGGPDAESRALAEAARLTGSPVTAWDELPMYTERPADETISRYWCEFTMSGVIPSTEFDLRAPEIMFREFLREKYGASQNATVQSTLSALNRAWKTDYASFDDIPLPLVFYDYIPVRFHPNRLRISYLTESYERVFEYLIGRGRAAQNTLILVLLSLLSALTINPIAAYSLSRFPMKHTQKVLIFFLATMAFPAEVAMIPNFLLLRDLGLLNTYAALVLPRMANGFAIFLLKGFYDSLPQELYQAAEIDGASELQIFRMVAMPLVLPILAYIGLNTFVLAYSSFMWAFVICPKQEMWTLMVWVYDFQMNNPGNNYVMAATVLVSIPPLLVFLFVNRIIMKGIVIPSMK